MNSLAPFRLQPTFAARTWGRTSLVPWYPDAFVRESTGSDEPVGEAWLTGPQCIAQDGPARGMTLGGIAAAKPEALLGPAAASKEFPLLIKLLFPDAKLSVQVHPDDAEANRLGMERGKTECWYVLEAEPGAAVACGLKPGVSLDALRASIPDGSTEDLLQHLPIAKGDLIFVDAGTVHAIGPGATMLEIQQTSDTTYRLYDYGRPRELHIDAGLRVTKLQTRAGKIAPQPLPNGGTRLVQETYFTVDSFSMQAGDTLTLGDAAGKPHCITALYGDAEVAAAGESRTPLPASSSVVIPASTGPITIKALGQVEIVRAMP